MVSIMVAPFNQVHTESKIKKKKRFPIVFKRLFGCTFHVADDGNMNEKDGQRLWHTWNACYCLSVLVLASFRARLLRFLLARRTPKYTQ